mgnify:CR=1 FL=1
MNLDTHRVVAILSDTYYKDAGIDTYEDPTAPYPTDRIKDFAFATPSTAIDGEPFVCESMAAPEDPEEVPEDPEEVTTDGVDSSGSSIVSASILFGLAVAAFV